MKKILSILFLLSSFAFADDCLGLYIAGDYEKSGSCFIDLLKNDKSSFNYIEAGVSLSKQGRYKEALQYLKKAEQLSKSERDLMICYSHLSTLYSYLGDKNNELFYDMKFLNLALKIENKSAIGSAYNNLGSYYQNIDDNKALEYFSKALEYKEEKERAMTYQNMAISYDNLNDKAKAEEFYKKVIDISINTGDYWDLCVVKTGLGVFYRNENRIDEAISTLNDSKNICHKAGYISREANALITIGVIYAKKGDKISAKEYYTEAKPLAEKSGDKVVLNNLEYLNSKLQ